MSFPTHAIGAATILSFITDQPVNLLFALLANIPDADFHILGKEGHRTWTHSLLIATLAAMTLWIFVPIEYAFYFWVVYVSHIFLDLFNKVPTYIFYPATIPVKIFPGKSGIGVRSEGENYIKTALTIIFLFRLYHIVSK